MDSPYLSVAILGQLAFILAVVGVLLGFLLRRFLKENRRLRQKLRTSTQSTLAECNAGQDIPGYLGRQVELTQQRLSSSTSHPSEHHAPDSAFSPWELRRYCLAAERDALQFEEGSSPYWEALDASLTKFAQRFQAPASPTKEMESWKNKVTMLRERVEKLRQFEARCGQAEAALARSNAEIETLRGQVGGNDQGMTPGTSSPPTALSRCSDNADLISDKLVEQRQTILDLREKLRQFQLQLEVQLHKAVDPDLEKRMQQRIDTLEKDLACSEIAANALQTEMGGMKRSLDEARNLARQAEGALAKAGSDPLLRSRGHERVGGGGESNVIYVHEAVAEPAAGNEVALEHARAAYSRAEREVKNLQDVSQRQRRMILELENELTTMRLEVGRSEEEGEVLEEKKQALERLEKLYRESEMCVTVLESEVEDLQQRLEQMAEDLQQDKEAFIDALNRGDYDESLPDQAANDYPAEIQRLKTELDNLSQSLNNAVTAHQEQSEITCFASLALKAGGHAELAKELMTAANQMGVAVAIQVRSQLGKVDAADVGKISNQDKSNLQAIKYDGGDKVIPVKGGFVLADTNVSMFVKEPASGQPVARLKKTLESMVSIASLVAEKIEHGAVRDKQKKRLDKLVAGVDKGLANICVKYRFQTGEANKIVNRLLKELHVSLGSMSLSDVQKCVFEEMLSDCQERMALLFATGLSLDESMEGLLESLKQRQAS